MIAYAYGELGIEYDHLFYKMSLGDFYIKRYFNEKRKGEAIKVQYESARYVGTYLLSPHIDFKKRRPTGLKDIIPLPWEIEQPVKLTDRQRKKIEAERKAHFDEQIAKHRLIWAQQAGQA